MIRCAPCKLLLLAVASLLLSACGYNTIQVQDEQMKAAWSEVVNQYQRRADLIPNLVNTVKGFAAQEQAVLIGVTEARAKADADQGGRRTIPASLQQFQAAQGELSSALSRLMVVVEKYPELKSDQNFRDLQAQLEGTENRITVARNRYIQAVQDYNVTVRRFPTNLTAMLFGYKVKPNFTVENEAAIAKPPTVDFAAPPAPASGADARAGDQLRHLAPRPREARRGPRSRVAPSTRAGCAAAATASRWLWRLRHLRPACAQSRWSPVPPLTARVTDLTGTLTADQAAALEAKLAAFEQAKGSQVAVLIVPTTQPEEIEQYCDPRRRGLEARPRKGVDDGAILLVALQRPQGAHRGRLRARGRAARRDGQSHHRRRTSFRASSAATTTAASAPAWTA